MQLLPIVIRTYNLDIDPACFVRKIRANSISQYNDDGFISDHNPYNLLFRNEKEKGIYLKEQRDLKTRYGGGTTALFLSDSNSNKTKITTIAYFGWQQSFILLLLLIALIYTAFYSPKDTLTIVIGMGCFLLIFALTSSKALVRQKQFIEMVIESCKSVE